MPRPDGGELTVLAVPAVHGPEDGERGPDGQVNCEVTGFVLSGEGLPSVYVSGDNASLRTVAAIARRGGGRRRRGGTDGPGRRRGRRCRLVRRPTAGPQERRRRGHRHAERRTALKGLGATTVVDYTAGDVAGQVRAAHPEGVDALIDLVSYTADGLALDAVRKGGRVASVLGAADDEALAAAGLAGANIMAMPTSDITGPLARRAAEGTLSVDVTSVLPFEKATEGLGTLASGTTRGKIVVTVAD